MYSWINKFCYMNIIDVIRECSSDEEVIAKANKYLYDNWDMNELGCRKGLFDMWLKTYEGDCGYEVMDGGNGYYMVRTRNFGKERYGMAYKCIPYRMEYSDDVFWYDILVHSVSDSTPMIGVHYMSYDEIKNRCRSYYEKE